jgi:hypothetical protein
LSGDGGDGDGDGDESAPQAVTCSAQRNSHY